MVAEVTSAREAAAGGRRRSYFPLVIAAIVVVGVFFIINSSFSGGVYDYASLAALNADWEAAQGKEIQVTGDVVANSIRGDADRLDITFDIADGSGGKISIHYGKILPDPFAEGRQVIVTGVLKSQTLLEADSLTVKCPSRYQDGEATEEEANKYYRDKHGAPGAGNASPGQ